MVKESLERRADAGGESTSKWADAAHLLGFVTCIPGVCRRVRIRVIVGLA